MIVVLDCGIGNVLSVAKMITKAGGEVLVSNAVEDIQRAEVIVFPGVGSFDSGISKLRELASFHVIEQRVVNKDVVFLGICVGMQLLFESSEEGELPGLGWISGKVIRFCENSSPEGALKIPHMGWNSVEPGKANDLLNFDDELRFYFVHSFYVTDVHPKHVMGWSIYGSKFASAVAQDNVYGVQFHPEKSHRFGLTFFKSFLEHAKC